MTSVVEQVWDALVTAFDGIDGSADLGDGAGPYRTNVKHVYKCVFRGNDYPTECPSISVWLKNWEVGYDESNDVVYEHIAAEFLVAGYVNATNDPNGTTRQTKLSMDALALQHDMMRVVSSISQSHMNTDPKFIVKPKTAIKVVNATPFSEATKGEFGFKLPIIIQWYGKGLVSG